MNEWMDRWMKDTYSNQQIALGLENLGNFWTFRIVPASSTNTLEETECCAYEAEKRNRERSGLMLNQMPPSPYPKE